jgi:hypothetical protein
MEQCHPPREGDALQLTRRQHRRRPPTARADMFPNDVGKLAAPPEHRAVALARADEQPSAERDARLAVAPSPPAAGHAVRLVRAQRDGRAAKPGAELRGGEAAAQGGGELARRAQSALQEDQGRVPWRPGTSVSRVSIGQPHRMQSSCTLSAW